METWHARAINLFQRNLQIYTQVKLRNMVCKACKIGDKDNGLGCMSGAGWSPSLVSVCLPTTFLHTNPASISCVMITGMNNEQTGVLALTTEPECVSYGTSGQLLMNNYF